MIIDDRKQLLTNMEAAYKKARNSVTNRRAKMNAVLKEVQKKYFLYAKDVPFK